MLNSESKQRQSRETGKDLLDYEDNPEELLCENHSQMMLNSIGNWKMNLRFRSQEILSENPKGNLDKCVYQASTFEIVNFDKFNSSD